MIYELHVGALGSGTHGAGHPRRRDGACSTTWSTLGVNAVELLPLSEFTGRAGLGLRRPPTTSPSSSAPAAATVPSTSCASATAAASPSSWTSSTTTTTPTPSGPQWQYDSHRPGAEHLLLVRGHQPVRLRRSPDGRLRRQRVERVRAAVLGGDGPPAVHQQRRGAGRGVPRRRLARRPDDVDPPLHRPPRRRPARRAAPTSSARSSCASGRRTLQHDRPGVMLIAEDHTGWDAVTQAPGGRRPRLRRGLVRRLLPPPDRRRRRWRAAEAACCKTRRLRRRRPLAHRAASPARC